MIEVREAVETDVAGIRDLFLAAYGQHYAYPSYYDLQVLKKMVFDDDTLFLVAWETETDRILGTASVIYDLGEFGDLVGEFGRLVVHPEGRKKGIGKKLMETRIGMAGERLHLGFAENRVPHPFSQRISHRFGFAPAGFLPQKHCFKERESLAIYVKYFGDALRFRRNHPRVIPEAFLLAQKVLSSCAIEPDAIPDDASPPYPDDRGFEIEEMTTRGYAPLLRFERARAGRKEIFGPARIHQGLFRLRATHSNYIIAREEGQLIGAVGYTTDEVEKTATIFELVSLDNRPVRFLVDSVIDRCRREYGVEYIETDVSAYSPSMQRTLLELRFLPVGYLPAFSFQGSERLDAIRMARLFVPVDMSDVRLFEATKPVAEIVLRNFSVRDLMPRLGEALPKTALFAGLGDEQIRRLAEICALETYPAGTTLIEPGQEGERGFVILDGEITVAAVGDEADPREVGTVSGGEFLGETALLNRRPHSVHATAARETEAAVIRQSDLTDLMRRRPDIGLILYQNLARSLGRKLREVNAGIARRTDS